MKRLLLLLALGLFLAGCGDTKPTQSYHYTHPPCPVDTAKVCPSDSCKDVPDCDENGNCEHNEED